jgi:hypothetical protein
MHCRCRHLAPTHERAKPPCTRVARRVRCGSYSLEPLRPLATWAVHMCDVTLTVNECPYYAAIRQGSMIHIWDEQYRKLVEQNFHEAFFTHTSTSPNYQVSNSCACDPYNLYSSAHRDPKPHVPSSRCQY